VEALVGVAAVLVAVSNLPVWVRIAAGWWLLGAIVLGCVDALVHRLPLRLVAAMSAGTICFGALDALGSGAHWAPLQRSLLVGALLAVVLFVLCLPRGGLGLGDAALALPVGFALGWFGWPTAVAWVLVASLLTGLTSLTLLAAGKVKWTSALPLGPFMLAAVVLSVALT
jgi:leader peptidase (prepilin peptidase)/N-methyltransferase